MATKEVLTKQEEYDRAVKSLEINEHRLNVITRRIPELEAELQEAVVKQEIKGYAANTIKKLRDEISHLQSEKDSLEFSITAMQKAIPELRREADIERTTAALIELEQVANDCYDAITQIPAGSFNAAINDLTKHWDNADNVHSHFGQKSREIMETATRLKLQDTVNDLRNLSTGVKSEMINKIDELDAISENLRNMVARLRISFAFN